MHRLLLATHNNHKAEEFRALLEGSTIEVLTLDSFPNIGEIHEDQNTLEGNALKKAREVFRATGLPSLADDTGLEVVALNGAPGVISARFAGPGATYADNVKKLLAVLRETGGIDRRASFRSVLAFVAPNFEHLAEGKCSGTIIENARGAGGFGYDPVFVPEGHDQTFAEMPMILKNSLSHRARALHNIRPVLLAYFNGQNAAPNAPSS